MHSSVILCRGHASAIGVVISSLKERRRTQSVATFFDAIKATSAQQ
jgi:hypothetical protein